MFTIGPLYDLLCPQPHLYVSGEVLRHRLPAEVQVGVHGVPGQESGGPRLDHGGPAGSPQELDTGKITEIEKQINTAVGELIFQYFLCFIIEII